jgi:bifunctional UDP-N-acetylglucosamine pyrophosphorylase / glucosamine-1-phosphate N-acetyltransferase
VTPPSTGSSRGTLAVILAAGLGTRMKSRTPKVLHPLCGRPMLAYVIDAAREATGERPLVVYSAQTEQVREIFAEQADFALQDEPRGTGDALAAALRILPDDVAEIVVLSGDTPLVTPATVTELLELRRQRARPMSIGAMMPADPAGYGRLIVTDGEVERIVEDSDASQVEREIELVNGGAYAFDVEWLRRAVPRLTPSPATGEIYLTQLVELAASDGTPAVTSEQAAQNGWLLAGVNDRVELADAETEIQLALLERHMRAGVTIRDPANTWIEATVEIDQDVTIEPNVILKGATRIGRDTTIRAGSQLINAEIGERCTVWASVIEDSRVGDGVRVGPFAHLRAGCVVGDGCEIGNFAEQKNTRFGARSKQHHFSYLGDAEIGEDVNIGAGTITANYDGARKHATVIGDRAFIGSDTILRAPISVGEGAYTGAGSVVTKDVPAGKLAVGVPARIRERRTAE